MSNWRIYLPVRTFELGRDTPTLSVWTADARSVKAPYGIALSDDEGDRHVRLFDIAHRFEDLEIASLTPLITVTTENAEQQLQARGFVKVETPLDDPFCGACGKMCSIHWEFEDTAGDGPARWGAEGVSDCCEVEMFADPCLIVPFDPDPNEHGAFEPSEPDEVID